MPIRSVLIALVALCALAPPAVALTVALGPETVLRSDAAGDGSTDSLDTESVFPATVPVAGSTSAASGSSTAEGAYELTDSGFRITLHNAWGSEPNAYSSGLGGVDFTVDRDVIFEAVGTYAAVDPEGRYVSLFVILEDVTLDEVVFSSQQVSNATPNESFSLVGTRGDSFNRSIGSLTGTLIAGHRYRFGYQTILQNRLFPPGPPGSPGGPATATGTIQLRLIPEPSTAMMLGLGLLLASGLRRRDRSQRNMPDHDPGREGVRAGRPTRGRSGRSSKQWPGVHGVELRATTRNVRVGVTARRRIRSPELPNRHGTDRAGPIRIRRRSPSHDQFDIKTSKFLCFDA